MLITLTSLYGWVVSLSQIPTFHHKHCIKPAYSVDETSAQDNTSQFRDPVLDQIVETIDIVGGQP